MCVKEGDTQQAWPMLNALCTLKSCTVSPIALSAGTIRASAQQHPGVSLSWFGGARLELALPCRDRGLGAVQHIWRFAADDCSARGALARAGRALARHPLAPARRLP